MKSYFEIGYYGKYWNLPVIAFDKLDGSNLRFEYSHKRGFYKFGTRTTMIDRNSEPFGIAINIFLNKYEKPLTELFKSKAYRDTLSFVCFTEFYGEKSEFGQHEFDNDIFDIILLDINRYKKGMIPPRQLIKDAFNYNFKLPKIVYEGPLNKSLVHAIKDGMFDLKEGVVCKGTVPNKKAPHNLYYCKIKTNKWFDRLRNKLNYGSKYEEEHQQMITDSGNIM